MHARMFMWMLGCIPVLLHAFYLESNIDSLLYEVILHHCMLYPLVNEINFRDDNMILSITVGSFVDACECVMIISFPLGGPLHCCSNPISRDYLRTRGRRNIRPEERALVPGWSARIQVISIQVNTYLPQYSVRLYTLNSMLQYFKSGVVYHQLIALCVGTAANRYTVSTR